MWGPRCWGPGVCEEVRANPRTRSETSWDFRYACLFRLEACLFRFFSMSHMASTCSQVGGIRSNITEMQAGAAGDLSAIRQEISELKEGLGSGGRLKEMQASFLFKYCGLVTHT